MGTTSSEPQCSEPQCSRKGTEEVNFWPPGDKEPSKKLFCKSHAPDSCICGCDRQPGFNEFNMVKCHFCPNTQCPLDSVTASDFLGKVVVCNACYWNGKVKKVGITYIVCDSEK